MGADPRSTRRRKDALGWVLIVAMLAVLSAIGAAFALMRPPQTDEASLCRTDAPPNAQTLILVDATDKLAPRHRKLLEAVIKQERARLAPYDRLTILALRADAPQEPRALFSMCLPRDARRANPLFENPAHMQARWDAGVGKALKSATRRAAATGPAQVSPILASVRAASADPDFVSAKTKRLVLISDLLENDPAGFSAYRAGGADDDELARALSRPAALRGVSVRIVTFDRPDELSRQDAARALLWTPFFQRSGAEPVSWDPIG
jgi:hypothetical protein